MKTIIVSLLLLFSLQVHSQLIEFKPLNEAVQQEDDSFKEYLQNKDFEFMHRADRSTGYTETWVYRNRKGKIIVVASIQYFSEDLNRKKLIELKYANNYLGKHEYRDLEEIIKLKCENKGVSEAKTVSGTDYLYQVYFHRSSLNKFWFYGLGEDKYIVAVNSLFLENGK